MSNIYRYKEIKFATAKTYVLGFLDRDRCTLEQLDYFKKNYGRTLLQLDDFLQNMIRVPYSNWVWKGSS